MTNTAHLQERPLRADAERNRQAILCAAARVFAEEGTAVTLEHIAQVAGVGVGTIYRRFPTLDDLVAVVMEAKISRYADRAEHAAVQARSDPATAFEEYVLYILEQQATDLAFSELILSPRTATTLFRSEIARALDASITLVDHAKAAGVIRADFDHSDLYILLNANNGIVRGMGGAAPTAGDDSVTTCSTRSTKPPPPRCRHRPRDGCAPPGPDPTPPVPCPPPPPHPTCGREKNSRDRRDRQ